MKQLIIVLALFLTLASCDRVKDGAKKTINKGGETVGKATTEFFEGVTEGVDKTLQCELILSEILKEKGLKTGKFFIENSEGGKKNLLTLYLIFDKDFKGNLTVKVSDKEGLEIGRAAAQVEGKVNQAKYFDFVFDKRTDIEVKSQIRIE